MKSILTNLHRKLDLLDALAEQLTIEPSIILDPSDEAPQITVYSHDHRAVIDALGADGWKRKGGYMRTHFDHWKTVCGVRVQLYKAEPRDDENVPADVPAEFWAATIPAHMVEETQPA